MGVARIEKWTILVVDDRIEFAENIAEILASAGYDALVADTCQAAEALVLAGGVTALITDYRLQGATGIDLIRRLRSNGYDLPAVVVSAHTDARTVEEARRAGAREFFPKPIDIDRLLREVAELAPQPGP